MARTLGEGQTLASFTSVEESRTLGDGISVGESKAAGLAGHPLDTDEEQAPAEIGE